MLSLSIYHYLSAELILICRKIINDDACGSVTNLRNSREKRGEVLHEI